MRVKWLRVDGGSAPRVSFVGDALVGATWVRLRGQSVGGGTYVGSVASSKPRSEASEWRLVGRVRNPWGEVPVTGGVAFPGRARAYIDELQAQHRATDPSSRRHHYVPRAYLREWSFNGKQVWALDTVAGTVRPLGIADVCVEEDFYRVVGADGLPHNRVELLFGVVDRELRRVQALFKELDDPESLRFDDLIGLAVTVAVQRMRTLQQRRLRQQHHAWLVAQNPRDFTPITDDHRNPHRAAGIHTRLLFDVMWEAADVMSTRQIEVWHDPAGRFLTCDAPVLVPFIRNVRPSLLAAPYVIWPVSPYRVVALGNDLVGEKAVIRTASGKLIGLVRDAIEQGRERMIFASESERGRLRPGPRFRRRTQLQLRCPDHDPNGGRIQPPGCCVESRETFAIGPDVVLCEQGLHVDAPDMWLHD